MAKPIVFISHIKEEKDIAIALKKLLEQSFLDMVDVFVSADPTSIQVGQQWLKQIEFALRTCAVELILCSQAAVLRPWVNFEAGSGWIREIPVIPLCHSGMTPEKLPAPLSTLQAVVATEEPKLKLLLPQLAKALGSAIPAVDFSEFIESVKAFENESKQSAEIAARTPLVATDGLSQHEITALVTIANLMHGPSDTINLQEIHEAMNDAGFTNVATNLALRILARKSLAEFREEAGQWDSYTVVLISDEGWDWLNANSNLLTLHAVPKEAPPPEYSNGPSDLPF